jgi:putative glutamine amidotransferase
MGKSKVFVFGQSKNHRDFFSDHGYQPVDTLAEADVLHLTGGEDVTPFLYHEAHTPECLPDSCNINRDLMELRAVYEARLRRMMITGICRGAQMVNVALGGSLKQHVEGHTRPHKLRFSSAWRLDGLSVDGASGLSENDFTSTHHQVMVPSARAPYQVVAWDASNRDVEILLFPTANALCFQPHPEFVTANWEEKNLFMDLLSYLTKQHQGAQ